MPDISFTPRHVKATVAGVPLVVAVTYTIGRTDGRTADAVAMAPKYPPAPLGVILPEAMDPSGTLATLHRDHPLFPAALEAALLAQKWAHLRS